MNRPIDTFTRSSFRAAAPAGPPAPSLRGVQDAQERAETDLRRDRFIRSGSPEIAPRASFPSAPLWSVLGTAIVAGACKVRDVIVATYRASTAMVSDAIGWVVQKSNAFFRMLLQVIERDRSVAEQRTRDARKALDEVRHIQNTQLQEALSGLDRQAQDQSKRHRAVTADGQEASLRDQVRLGLTDDDDVIHTGS